MDWPTFMLSCFTACLAFAGWRLLRTGRRLHKIQAYLRQVEDEPHEGNAPSPPATLRWNEAELMIFGMPAANAASARWKNISKVSAYKLDLFSHDLVCVAFELDDETSIEIDESMNSFTELMEAMPNFLPGFLPFSDWYMNITTPAFETNLTLLYEAQDTGKTAQETG